jgi:hypothetical protein
MLIRRPAVGPLTGARMPTGYRSGRKWKATRAREPPAVPAGGRRKSGAWTGKTRSNVRRRIRHRAKYGGEEAPSEGPGGSAPTSLRMLADHDVATAAGKARQRCPGDLPALGPRPVRFRCTHSRAAGRDRGRTLPCDVWRPIGRATRPLVLVSHFSGGHRRSSTFLCRHLASHGYAVVAIDHSEIVAPELAAQPDADQKARAARAEAIIASRVPDLRLALDVLARDAELAVDGSRVGLVMHKPRRLDCTCHTGRRAADRRRRSAGASRKLPPAAGYRTRAAAVHLEPRRTDIDPHRRRRRHDPAGRSQRGVLPDPVDEAPVRPGRC